MSLLTPLLITLSILEISPTPNYYWRRFYGQVPFDAVAATDTNQDTIYIGRALFETRGMLVGPITECSKNVTVTTWSTIISNQTVHSVDKFNEILCSPLPHTPFKWIPTTAQALLNQRGLVEGGFQSIGPSINTTANGVLYIGRIKDDKQTVKIGKVLGPYQKSYEKYNHLYYADGQDEKWTDAFEVLIYEDRNETSDKTCPSSPGNIWPQDYYWRKFYGVIPDDAIGAPQKNQTFIGRAPFERKGFLVGSIVAGSGNITVTHGSDVSNDTVHHLDQFVEILCSSSYPKGFAWVDTTAESLLYRTGRIEAGFEFNNDKKHEGVLNIGLIWQGVRLKIGKVVGYFKDDVMNNNLFYDQNGKEAAANLYAVLTYDYSTNFKNYTKNKDYVQ